MAHCSLFLLLAQLLFELLDLPVQADVGIHRALEPELGRSGLRFGRFDPPVSFALALRDRRRRRTSFWRLRQLRARAA